MRNESRCFTGSVSCRTFIAAAAVVAICAVALAVDPLPAEQRIAASIVSTMAAPAADPMFMPTDLALGQGDTFVADGANDRVAHFRGDGSFDEYFSSVGAERLSRPVGLCIDDRGNLWIADTGNHRILVRSPQGKLLAKLDPPRSDDGSPAGPTSIAITADGSRAYIVDNAAHRLLIRDNNTGIWTSMGKPGKALGEFQWPFMACIGAEGYLAVTEAIGARVQFLSPTNRWAGSAGHFGVAMGDLFRPKGIAADRNGRLYVGDSTTNVVQVFAPRGDVEGVLTDAKGIPIAFQHPMGMRFDPAGRLYIVELLANRVAIVTLEEPRK